MIPKNFYHAEAWQKNIIDFYTERMPNMPKEALEAPVQYLTESVYIIICLYRAHPGNVKNALEFSVNPLYDIGEFEQKVIQGLRKEAEELKQPSIHHAADALESLRAFFMRDEAFLRSHFAASIACVKAEKDQKKYTIFADAMHMITKQHHRQLAKMIKSYE